MSRPTWDQTWMSIAETMGLRSLCEGAQVGAIIVDATNRPISTGYNGPPRNLKVSGGCSTWCDRKKSGARRGDYGLNCPSVHAEANALMFADRRHNEGGTIYVTRSCCADCAKLVANSGVKRIVMRVLADDAHRNPGAITKFLRDSGLEVTVLTEPVTID